ncbi:hypothetical protein V6N13_097660 [Hibiscus sabdariffa]
MGHDGEINLDILSKDGKGVLEGRETETIQEDSYRAGLDFVGEEKEPLVDEGSLLMRSCYWIVRWRGMVDTGTKCSKPGGEVAEWLVLMEVLVADLVHCHE